MRNLKRNKRKRPRRKEAPLLVAPSLKEILSKMQSSQPRRKRDRKKRKSN
jgi:hypothetical protein